VVASSGIDYLDPFRYLLIDDATVDRRRAHALAKWFARGAADREVVKWALATLRVVSWDEVDLLLTLGRHEEFTSHAVDAARDLGPDGEPPRTAVEDGVQQWVRPSLRYRPLEVLGEITAGHASPP